MSLKTIGKYEVVSTLGRGSMGVVYKARDPEIGRLVAIKTLRAIFLGEGDEGSEALKRFRQESRSAGMLRHPNIVTIFEAGRASDGTPFIVMEHIDGRSLEQVISEHASLDINEKLHYLAQIASAIDYAHSQNVIHRDIKPSNVIVDDSGHPNLLDFGVAKLSDTSLTPAGTVVGTPSYMSPEQIRGERLDSGTDLFAFGVMSFELFTGQRPFPGKDFTTVVNNILHKDPINIDETGVELSPQVQKVLIKGVIKEKSERFTGALEFISALAKECSVVIDGTGVVGGFQPKPLATSLSESSHTLIQDAPILTPKEPAEDPVEDVAEDAVESEEEKSIHEEVTVAQSMVPKMETSEPKGEAKESSPVEPPPAEEKSKEQASQESAPTPPPVSAAPSSSAGKRMLGLLVIAAIVAGGAGYYFIGQKGEVAKRPEAIKTEVAKVEQPAVEGADSSSSAEKATLAGVGTSDGKGKASGSTQAATAKEPEKAAAKSKITQPKLPPEQFTPLAVAGLEDEELRYVLTSGRYKPKHLRLAVIAAGRKKTEEFTALLADMVEDKNYLVRVEVLKALSREPHASRDQGIAAMMSRLADKEYLVRGFAAKQLGSIASPAAASALEERLLVEDNKTVKKVLEVSLTQVREALAKSSK